MSNINIIVIDELYNIMESINLNKPKTYSDLLTIIKNKSKKLSNDYHIFYLTDDYKEKIILNEKEYSSANDLLYIRNIEESEQSTVKLEESLNNIYEDKNLCIICREIIKDEKPLFCYRCQKLYHKKCLENWKNNEELNYRQLKCPSCKYDELELENWKYKNDYEDNLKREEKTLKIIKEYNKYKTLIPKIFKKLLIGITEVKSILKIRNKK